MDSVFGSAHQVGRPLLGRRSVGVPPGGPWDPESMLVANALVGNGEWEVVLELGLAVFMAEVARAGWLALAGLGHAWSLDGREAPVGGSVWAREGAKLLIERQGPGCRASLSTPGGWSGRGAVVRGQVIESSQSMAAGAIRQVGTVRREIRGEGLAVVGLQSPLEGLVVSRSMDRTGIRIEGASVQGFGGLPSRPVTMGILQRTPDGTLIVVGPDGPTLGGYEVAGCLTALACAELAQLSPDEPCRLVPVDLTQAWDISTSWWKDLSARSSLLSAFARPC